MHAEGIIQKLMEPCGSNPQNLARSSHQLSTAADDASYPDVFSHFGVLNVPQVRLRAPK